MRVLRKQERLELKVQLESIYLILTETIDLKRGIKDFVDSIEENDTDIVINSFYKEFVGEIHHVKNHFQEGFYDENKIKKIILPELISSKNYFSHGISTYLWGKLFKKDLLIGHQLSVPSEFSVGEDAVVTFPYIADCKSLTIIDKPNYFYRQRAQSMLKTINKIAGIKIYRKLNQLPLF